MSTRNALVAAGQLRQVFRFNIAFACFHPTAAQQRQRMSEAVTPAAPAAPSVLLLLLLLLLFLLLLLVVTFADWGV